MVETELERRFNALRTPTKHTLTDDEITTLLESLESPTTENENKLSITIKNLNPTIALAGISSNPTSPSSTTTTTTTTATMTTDQLEEDSKLANRLQSLESTVSVFESIFNPSNSMTPIEITFKSPPTIDRSTAEEEELMNRLRDELSLEKIINSDSQEGLSSFEKRLQGLKDYKSPAGESPVILREGGGVELGLAPSIVDSSDFKLKKKKKGSSSDSEDSDEESTEEEKDSEDSD